MLSIADVSLTSVRDVTEKTLSGYYTRRSFFVRFERRNQGAADIVVVDHLRVLDYDPELRKLTLWYGTPGPAGPERYVGYPKLVLLRSKAVDTVETEVPAVQSILVPAEPGNESSVTHDLTQLRQIELRIRWSATPLESSDLPYPYAHILVQDMLGWGSELAETFDRTVPGAVA